MWKNPDSEQMDIMVTWILFNAKDRYLKKVFNGNELQSQPLSIIIQENKKKKIDLLKSMNMQEIMQWLQSISIKGRKYQTK